MRLREISFTSLRNMVEFANRCQLTPGNIQAILQDIHVNKELKVTLVFWDESHAIPPLQEPWLSGDEVSERERAETIYHTVVPEKKTYGIETVKANWKEVIKRWDEAYPDIKMPIQYDDISVSGCTVYIPIDVAYNNDEGFVFYNLCLLVETVFGDEYALAYR